MSISMSVFLHGEVVSTAQENNATSWNKDIDVRVKREGVF